MTVEPTEEQITEAPEKVARRQRLDEDGWRFTSLKGWHSEKNARMIARACLILGIPVSEIISIRFASAIIDRVLAIEKKLQA